MASREARSRRLSGGHYATLFTPSRSLYLTLLLLMPGSRSHWHFDHTGDPSTFPPNTALVVGPGFTQGFTPGYPDNPQSPINTSDYAGRELREITFAPDKVIGSFSAHDYFGDGSFYLLDTPGHAIGHLCGLARTTSPLSPEGESFIFMGGDLAHHGGEFRPSPHLPLPSSIVPNPFSLAPKFAHTLRAAASSCPGHLFSELNASRGRKEPGQTFFDVARAAGGSAVAHDADEAERTIHKVQVWDVRDDIFVVFAHDETLSTILDLFPRDATHWKEKGWAKQGKWAFLKDFAEAVAGSE